MQHNVAVVGQNPVALSSVAFNTEPAVTVLPFQLAIDFVCNRVHLAMTGSSRDDEEIDDRGDTGQIQYQNLLAAQLVGDLRRHDSIRPTDGV